MLGASPPEGALRLEIVGSDSSSATNGSSVASVAGKNRLPANPCAESGPEATRHAHAAKSETSVRLNVIVLFPCIGFSIVSILGIDGAGRSPRQAVRQTSLTELRTIRPGADVVRCDFIAVDFHHLLPGGREAHAQHVWTTTSQNPRSSTTATKSAKPADSSFLASDSLSNPSISNSVCLAS